ncbi:MAG TPA: DUF309 domain-containing protein [Methylomirabilota bacterium]|nr:DUF309 domain-containing protein [Methylomirabilota bacterium]
MIPALPLAQRNRLAEIILAAFHDERAREELAALATPQAAERWLAGAERRWTWALTERARRAASLHAGRALRPEKRDLAAALEDAALLFDAGLHFEVHEMLEPYWAESAGETREALQGLIQAAVGFQHLANGNLPGARSLLLEAGKRLHRRRLLGRDLDGFAQTAAELAERAGAGEPVAPPDFPR